jgi:hypothetical protein
MRHLVTSEQLDPFWLYFVFEVWAPRLGLLYVIYKPNFENEYSEIEI